MYNKLVKTQFWLSLLAKPKNDFYVKVVRLKNTFNSFTKCQKRSKQMKLPKCISLSKREGDQVKRKMIC